MTFRPTHASTSFLLCLLTWQICFAEETKDAAENVVRKLGSSSFLEREDASQQLMRMGSAAEAALIAAAKGTDREIQDRASRILRLIREQQRRQLLTEFRRTKPDESNADAKTPLIPGWPRFAKSYGDSEESRRLYASMLESEWALIESCFSSTDDFQRRNQLARQRSDSTRQGINYYNSELGTALTLFYLYAQYPESPGPGLHQYLFQYINNPRIKERLLGPSRDEMIREIVGDWLIATTGSALNDRNVVIALQQARIFRLEKPSRVIGERVLTNKDSLPLTKRTAMEAIVLRNDKSQVKLIEPFLSDKTVLGTSQQRSLQLRDFALASVMYLKGHDVTKVGVKLRTVGSNYAFEYKSLGYITEGDRKKAFETYRKLEEQKADRQ